MYIDDKRTQSTKCYYKDLTGHEAEFFESDGKIYLNIDREKGLVYNFDNEIVDHFYGGEIIQPVRVCITIEEDILIER